MSERMDTEKREDGPEEDREEEEITKEVDEVEEEGGRMEEEGGSEEEGEPSKTKDVEVEDYDKLPQRPQDDKLVLKRFLLEVFSGMYAFLIIALGLVLPVAIVLSGDNFGQDGIHLAIFHYYIYIVGIAFCIYLTVLVRRTKAAMMKGTKIDDVTDAESDVMGSKRTYVINDNVHAVRPDPGEGDEGSPEKLSGNRPEVPPLYECPEGVNFFLRMGLIGFGIAAVLLEGMRLVDIGRTYAMWQCYGDWHFAAVVFKLLFILVQTFTLFKYHSMGINIHKPLVKLGLLHVIATNLCMWMNIIVIETVEAFNQSIHLKRELDITNATVDVTDNITANITANGTVNATEDMEDDLGPALCLSFPDTLSTAASPYLFPFIIEYAFLAAAILYRMHASIGPQRFYQLQQKKILQIRDRERFPDLYTTQPAVSDCSKANTGLFIGMAVFVAVATSLCFHLYFASMKEDQDTVLGYIYVISDLTVKSLIFVSLVPAYWKIIQLYFHGISESFLLQNLLIFALFGTYVLDCFIVVASVKSIRSDNELVSKASGMYVATSVMDFLQVTLIAAFIVDGLHRRSVTSQTACQKPGRSWVTFLLLLNLALWLINTFEMKMVHRYSIFSFYYGHLGWTIILSVTAPIAIFFRFQCAVCLSVIWTRAYTKEPAERLTDSQLEKCGKIL